MKRERILSVRVKITNQSFEDRSFMYGDKSKYSRGIMKDKALAEKSYSVI